MGKGGEVINRLSSSWCVTSPKSMLLVLLQSVSSSSSRSSGNWLNTMLAQSFQIPQDSSDTAGGSHIEGG
jgi:hypothetical protein